MSIFDYFFSPSQPETDDDTEKPSTLMTPKIASLHPKMQELAMLFLKRCKEEGITGVIYQALRTFQEQADLYAQGRTKPGKIVTNADAGTSWHNYGLAFDVAPTVNGKIDWNSPLFEKMGEIGKSIGLTWGGDFKSLKDRPHFEYHPGLTLVEAKKRWLRGDKLFPDSEK